MTRYDYKVIPAPSKGRKAPGVKGAEARFAHSIQELMNEMAAEGWCYQRADILPSTERAGLASSQTVYRSVLVFRRPHRPAEAAGPGPADTAAATVHELPEDDTGTLHRLNFSRNFKDMDGNGEGSEDGDGRPPDGSGRGA